MKKGLEGDAANQFLQGVAKPKSKSIEARLGDISYQLNLIAKELHQLNNK